MNGVRQHSAQVLGPVTIGPIAHGGHCVARFEGRVLFVRHALPGEVVRVRVTDDSQKRYWRADAVEILEASPHRRPAPCPVSGPGGCGGCDFQHVTETGQLELKTAVVAEQLHRLGGYAWTGQVEGVPPVLGWRTRMRYVTTETGIGLRAHRSHTVIDLPEEGCLVAAVQPGPGRLPGAEPGAEITVIHPGVPRTPADDIIAGPPFDPTEITEMAHGRAYTLAADGFWQVHPRAADLLVATVLEVLKPRAGERAFDLYCGVGLFAGALADAGVTVWGVESVRPAVDRARRNVPGARFTLGRVERTLDRLPQRTDLVVLDPPRSGAGKDVLTQVAQREPRAVAYVACDPAALGRDLGYAKDLGFTVESVRAFDLFPQTHHVECVALLTRAP